MSSDLSDSQNPFISAKQDPPWFSVMHYHQPSPKKIFRLMLEACLISFAILGISFFLPYPINLFLRFLALGFLGVCCFALYQKLYQQQRIRVIGHVLEYDNGKTISRISLTKAMVSLGAMPPNLLVLVFNDETGQLVIGRKAESGELSHLPIQMTPCLELKTNDFEELRSAAQRFYPNA